jgi:hypothetical protein
MKADRYKRVAEIAYAVMVHWATIGGLCLGNVHLNASYCDMKDWLLVSDKICPTLELKEVPDHTTLCCAFHRMKLKHWRAMHRLLLRNVTLSESMIALDSTGFRTDQASAY